MTSTTALTNYVEPDEISERTLAVWEKQAAVLAKSPMVPEHFRGKPDEIMIAFFGLHDIGVRPGPNTLQKCYVVHGKPGYMAQLQIAVAHRHSWEIEPVEGRCDAVSATVRIRRDRPNEAWRHVSFTWDEAVKAGLPGQNPTYNKFPAAMLFARATTRAIGQYCPEVLLGIDAAADHAAASAAAYLGREAPLPVPDQAPDGASASVGGGFAAPQEPGDEEPVDAVVVEDGDADGIGCRVPGCDIPDQPHQHDPYIEAQATRSDNVVQMPSPSATAWRAKCKDMGISQSELIRATWPIADSLGVDRPASLEDIVVPELVAELTDWMSAQRP